jgi:hypothetical protein
VRGTGVRCAICLRTENPEVQFTFGTVQQGAEDVPMCQGCQIIDGPVCGAGFLRSVLQGAL